MNAHRTRKILTGQLGGIEKLESGWLLLHTLIGTDDKGNQGLYRMTNYGGTETVFEESRNNDVNNLSNDILSWIEKNGLGSPTGRNEQSGFVVYPEYRFHPERLKELDDKGYAEYENLLKQQQQHMKKGWDR